MGKLIETKIDRFDGGIASDARDERTNVARFISNADVFTNPKRILPYRQTEAGDTGATTSRKQNFTIALRAIPDFSIYGLGVVSGTERPEVQYMDLSSLNGDTWTSPSANQGDTDKTAKFDCCVYYQKVNLIFSWAHHTTGGIRLQAFSPTGTAWDNDAGSLGTLGDTNTTVAQGLVHSKDDILYLLYDNIVVKNNNGAYTAAALTLPVHFKIASACEYGDHIAILCTDRNGVGNSRVFIWDRNETTTTLSESLDAGTGSGMIIEYVDGELIVISQKGGETGAFPTRTSQLTIPQSEITFRDKVIFRRLYGNRFIKIFEITADRTGGAGSTSMRRHKQLIDSRLFFQMIVRYNGSVRDGLWSFGRSAPDHPFTLVHEQPSSNNTALTTGDAMRGFIIAGDFIFQSFGSGGSGATYNTRKTIEAGDTSFSANTILETKTYDGGQHGFNTSHYKDLIEVSIMTDAMVTAGQIQLDYQTNVDADTGSSSWTTIFTHDTNSSLSHTAINIESSGASLPRQYKTIAFRIIATGGAIINGLSFKEQVIDKKHIDD